MWTSVDVSFIHKMLSGPAAILTSVPQVAFS